MIQIWGVENSGYKLKKKRERETKNAAPNWQDNLQFPHGKNKQRKQMANFGNDVDLTLFTVKQVGKKTRAKVINTSEDTKNDKK